MKDLQQEKQNKRGKLHLDVTHLAKLFINIGVTNSHLFLLASIW